MLGRLIRLVLFCVSVSTQFIDRLNFCRLSQSNELGICVPLRDCYDYQERRNIYKTLDVCGYNRLTGDISSVCCSSKTTFSNGVRSRQKCVTYNPNLYSLVVNTDMQTAKAKPKEFPHMASIGFGAKPKIRWLCGGTLISENFVLTAAHCVKSSNEYARWVRLGDLNIDATDDDADVRDVHIVRHYVHPNYKPPSVYNDIALLKITEVSSFGDYFRPACLHTEPTLSNRNLQAIGWGATSYYGKKSSHLLKVNLTLVGYKKCENRFASGKSSRLTKGIKHRKQICAGDLGGGDTCSGDSGGPLHYYVDEPTDTMMVHFVLVGITSFGKGCGGEDAVGVYTKVSGYVKWIEDIVWPLKETEEKFTFE